MVKKLPLGLLALLILFSQNILCGQNHFFGYCAYEEKPSTRTAIGYESDPSHLGAGAFFTKDFLKHYEGDQIIGLRIAVLMDVNNVHVYLANEVGKSAIEEKTTNLKAGWNEIYFKNPQQISNKDFFAAYDFDNLKEKNIIGVQSFGKADEHGIYISQFSGKYQKYSNAYGSNLMIQLIIKATHEHSKNRMYVNKITSPEYIKKGCLLNASIDVYNYGTNDIESIEVKYKYGNENTNTKTITTNVKPNTRHSINLDYGAITDSKDFIIEVVSCNGKNLDRPFEYKQSTYYYSESFERKIFQEELGTEMSSLAPYAYTDLLYAYPGYENKIVWVKHHVGYNVDKFTVEGSNNILFLYGSPATYNPAMMLNRRIMKGPYTVPVFATPWSERIQELYEEELMRPAFAKIDLEKTYDKENRSLSVQALGQISDDNISKDNCVVNILLIENNIMSNTQKGLEGLGEQSFVHQHTIRQFITDPEGEVPNWDGAKFSLQKENIKINEEWKDNDIQVVCFISKKLNQKDLSDCEVYNSNQISLIDNHTNIEEITSNHFTPQIIDKKIVLSPDYKIIGIYNIHGVKLENSNIVPGEYIIKALYRQKQLMIQKIIINKYQL